MGHSQQRAPRTETMREELQNTTWREQFAYLTASLSVESGHHGKNLGRTNFSGHSWEGMLVLWHFRFPMMKSFLLKTPELCYLVARENPGHTSKNPGAQSEQKQEERWCVWLLTFTTFEEVKQTKNKWTKKVKQLNVEPKPFFSRNWHKFCLSAYMDLWLRTHFWGIGLVSMFSSIW